MKGTTNVPSVYVLLKRKGKLAFVLREHTGYKDGTYSLPAGHVEEGESFAIAAAREALEEVNVQIEVKDLRHVYTMQRHQGDHVRVDIFFEAIAWAGEIRNNEPDLHARLDWFDESNLPDTVMDYQLDALRAIARGETYIELGWQA